MVQRPLDYNYAHLEAKAFHLDLLGDEIITNLQKFFPDLITPEFTRNMEEHLDKIQDEGAE
jgi:DNA topoisomerase IA